MPQLNDLQSILLATAVQRYGGSLYPLADSVAGTGARLTKAMAALAKAGLVEERDTSDHAATCRTEGALRYGVFITSAGSAAIGVGEDGPASSIDPQPVEPVPFTRVSKASAVVALLQRVEGATLPELIAATGWLPHTTRAALTGLRKKGHAIDRGKRDDVTCYRIVAVAA